MKSAVLLSSVALASALVEGPWSDMAATPEARAHALVANMTLDEKLTMLHGPPTGPCCQCKTSPDCAYVGNVLPNKRLGIPPLTMNDGPQGFRDDNAPGTTTAWPSGLTMAASWDVDAMREWGEGMGKEFYGKGEGEVQGVCEREVKRTRRTLTPPRTCRRERAARPRPVPGPHPAQRAQLRVHLG